MQGTNDVMWHPRPTVFPGLLWPYFSPRYGKNICVYTCYGVSVNLDFTYDLPIHIPQGQCRTTNKCTQIIILKGLNFIYNSLSIMLSSFMKILYFKYHNGNMSFIHSFLCYPWYIMLVMTWLDAFKALTSKCDLDTWPSDLVHARDTMYHGKEHFCQVILKSLHQCRRYAPEKMWTFIIFIDKYWSELRVSRSVSFCDRTPQ